MKENEMLNRNRIIIMSCILLFVVVIVICVSAFFIQGRDIGDVCDKITLLYRPASYYVDGEKIELTKEDIEELNKLIDKIEFSDPVQSTLEVKYELNSCDDTYLIGSDNIIVKNGETVEAISGLDELKKFLDDKIKNENHVYFYSIDDGYKYNKIKLDDEDKTNIKKYWKEQNKDIEYLDLALMAKYSIVVDNDLITTDAIHHYAMYNDGYIVLDERIGNIIDKYFPPAEVSVGDLTYSINNNLAYFDSKYNKRGVYYDTMKHPGAPIIYTIASGEKNNGGYSINVDTVEIDNSGNVIVHVKEKSPSPDEYVVMAITYPICSVTFNKVPNNIKFITAANEELKIIAN